MARKPKTIPEASEPAEDATKPIPRSRAVADWRSEMAGAAQRAAETEQTSGGGKFFTMRAGVLKYDDVALPGSTIACVIAHGIHENVFYEASFDADNKTPPTCFAFWDPTKSDDDGPDDEMTPPETVDKEECFTRQSDLCSTCPQNEWGSAEKGKGKACGNRRRLAILPAGTMKSLGKNKGMELEMFEDEDSFKKADLGFMKLPVTSVKAYSAYVREVSEQLGRPLWGVYTQINVVPHDRYQVAVEFELIGEVPDELMDVIYKRHQEARDSTAFDYRPPSDDDDNGSAAPVANNAAKKLSGGAAKKPAAKPRRAK